MYQGNNIVMNDTHSQDTANAQEKHDSVLTMSCQLVSVDPARHARVTYQGITDK